MASNGVRHGAKPAAARLRELLAQPDKLVACPGVYDGLSARIALREGFDCLYMTGAGTAASKLGMPDLGIITMNDMLDNAGMIASLDRTVPVIADADTGYGGYVCLMATPIVPMLTPEQTNHGCSYCKVIYSSRRSWNAP